MIKKREELDKDEKKLVSFKKFSDLSGKKLKENPNEEENVHTSVRPFSDTDMPQGPNVHKEKTKKEKFMDTSHMKPRMENPTEQEASFEGKDVEFIGKIAKLPKGVKASKGYNFLENIKVSKASIWYLLIEKQDNELQMVKYNHKRGVDLSKFVKELKSYYMEKSKSNSKVCKMIENISIDGNDKYSWIKNIPPVEIDGKKMVTRITEDLIKLLSK
jgi:hypothetical protein